MPRTSIARIVGATLAVALLLPLAAAPAAGAPTLNPQGVRVIPGPGTNQWFSGHAGLYGWGAATLPNGNVLIGDYWNYRVQLYNKNGSLINANYISKPGHQPCQHQSPYGLGVDPRNGDVYIADTDKRGVDKWGMKDGTFQCLYSFGVQGAGPNKFKYPSRVAVADDGRAFVADTWDNLISIHNASTGAEITTFGSFGAGNGQFKQPHGMAFHYGTNRTSASDDRLYVVNTNNFRVDVFDASGTFLFKFGSKGSDPGQFTGDMRGLAIDQDNGWVYIVDAAGNRVSKFDLAGNFLLRWGSKGTGDGQFSDGGREVTVDGDGDVWVGDMPNFRAQQFSPTGQFLGAVPNPAQPPPPGGFNGPRGVALDSNGNIFVTDTYNQRVQKLANNGSFIDQWGSRGRSGDYGFNYARMIATVPTDDGFVVADTDNHRIRKYSNTGTLLWSIGVGGAGTAQFRNPHGVDAGPDGRVYVADTRNNRIVVLTANGNWSYAFGTTGSTGGGLLRPRGVAVDPSNGDIYVGDSNRDLVLVYSNSGTFLRSIGTPGTGDNQLANPFDVEVDANYVYIADSSTHKIKVWTKSGSFVTWFGGRGKALGKMITPQGLDLYGGSLYVSEQSAAGSNSDRIQEWSLFG